MAVNDGSFRKKASLLTWPLGSWSATRAVPPRCTPVLRSQATKTCRREYGGVKPHPRDPAWAADRKSTRLNSSHSQISYAVFCLKKKTKKITDVHSHQAESKASQANRYHQHVHPMISQRRRHLED